MEVTSSKKVSQKNFETFRDKHISFTKKGLHHNCFFYDFAIISRLLFYRTFLNDCFYCLVLNSSKAVQEAIFSKRGLRLLRKMQLMKELQLVSYVLLIIFCDSLN